MIFIVFITLKNDGKRYLLFYINKKQYPQIGKKM